MSDLINVLAVEPCPSPQLLGVFGSPLPVIVDYQVPELVNSPPVQANACIKERQKFSRDNCAAVGPEYTAVSAKNL
jgi:hypothetical protein